MNLAKFVQEGGTLITEGSTTTIFPAYAITQRRHGRDAGAAVRARLDPARQVGRREEPARLRLRRTATCRSTSTRSPVLNAGGGGIPPEFAGVLRRRRRGQRRASAQNITPNAQPLRISPLEPEDGGRGSEAAAGRGGGVPPHGARSSASASTTRARAWCCRSRRTRTTCCCRARSPTASSCRTARRWSTCRSARATS